jgi:flagellar biosynthesis/type III secretory pathway protein FliH
MSDLRTTPAQPYAFPLMSKLDESLLAAERAREAQLEAARNDAIAKGVAQGIAQGRLEAQIEARQLLQQSRQEGLDRGYADGLDEMRQAASALRAGLVEFEGQRAQIISEAGAFCVDLALAIVARLVETDSVRNEFVLRSVKSALRALAPENPTAVFVNPKVHQHLARAMEDLPLRDDENIATGNARVEAGRLLVQSSIADAFELIRSAVLESKANRQASLRNVRKHAKEGKDASDG